MNKIVAFITDIIVWALLYILLFSRISLKEVRKCRKNNDRLYTDKPDHWELALFLHDQADQRIFLLQAKLSGLLSLQSVLAGLYSLTSVLSKTYPRPILVGCLLITFLGIIVSIQPLSISTSIVADLDKYRKLEVFDPITQKEFSLAITDLGCRGDFYADCLSSAKTLIVLSILTFTIGLLMALDFSQV